MSKLYTVRQELKDFFEDDRFLSGYEFGLRARKILERFFDQSEKRNDKAALLNDVVNEFQLLVGAYALSQRKFYWQEVKRLYEAGALKKKGLMDYVMKAEGYSYDEAVKYVAETFGLKDSTQKVYRGREGKRRKREKEETEKRQRQKE